MRKLLGSVLFAAIFTSVFAAAAFGARTKDEIFKQADEEVKKVCLSMQQYMERPDNLKQVKVDATDEINAYADSGGNVVLFMGMVNFVQSADELAMVCGHEEAHLSAQHIKRSIGSSILSTVVSEVVGGVAGDVAGNLIYTKNSRKHERESDRLGLIYAWKAGYDPYTAAELWEGMSQVGGSYALGKYMSTHPVDKERVENFRVLLYRNCKDSVVTSYCDEIMNDPALKALYDQFETR